MKLRELDFVRAIAIAAVLVIHGTSDVFAALQGSGLSYTLYVILNKMSNFAVPVFLFVSGLVLFYRYTGDWKKGAWLRFYAKRLRSVVVPYAIWTLLYYLFWQILAHPRDWSTVRFDPVYYLKLLPSSNASYHLYFIIIIVQFYALFPLLMKLSETYAWFRRYWVPAAWLLQAAFYIYGHWFAEVPHRAELFLTYFGVFAAGAWVGAHYAAVAGWLQRRGYVALLAALLIGGAYPTYFLVNEHRFVFEHTWFEITFHLYGVAAGLALIRIGQLLLGLPARATGWLVSIGVCSYGIYYVHPAILGVYRRYVTAPGNIGLYHLYTLGGTLLVLLLSWWVTLLYRKAEKPFKGLLAPASGKTNRTSSAS
ncbi:acyltransferase [Paenibacillus cymbidii]|uniref:acyltransferase n=1 Tax=Paenibacillus cymbidii TaxID=1639034 RepID=UPI0010805FA4|nr:acyltransferase [Paenibacillus cymbidii]